MVKRKVIIEFKIKPLELELKLPKLSKEILPIKKIFDSKKRP